jgi:MFS family permease
MNQEEFDINQELDQMRQDYAALKERFDRQQIINDRLMEKAFKSNVRWLSADRLSGLIAGALGIPLIIAISIIKHVDWWFPAVWSIFIVIVIWAMLRMYRNLSKETLYEDDILSATKKVKRFKQQYQRFFFVSIASALALIGAYAPTVYHSWSSPEQGLKMLLLLGLIVVTLCVLGYLFYKRLMKACDSIIDQLQLKEKE